MTFDKIRQQIGSTINPYTFTRREIDKESGLYYYRARYYDSIMGRFINEDPIGFAGGSPNLYGYVLNNPVNFVDPDGKIVLAPLIPVAYILALRYGLPVTQSIAGLLLPSSGPVNGNLSDVVTIAKEIIKNQEAILKEIKDTAICGSELSKELLDSVLSPSGNKRHVPFKDRGSLM